MKKGFFCLYLFSIIALIGFTPIKADEFYGGDVAEITPAISQSDYDKINNTGYLIEFLRQGGEIDLTNSSYDNADDFIDGLSDFIEGTLYTILGEDTSWENPFNYNGINQLVQIYPNKKLGTNIKRFRNMLPSIESTSTPATPDTNYLQYINRMNTNLGTYDSFYWGDLEQIFYFYDGQDYQRYKYYPLNQYSYYVSNPNSSYNSWHYQALDQTTINIFEQDDRWYYTVSTYQIPMRSLGDKVTVLWYGKYTQYISPNVTTGVENVTQMNAWNSTPLDDIVAFTDSGNYSSLELLFQNISVRYRNVNIVVNGVTWANVGEFPHIDLDRGTYLDGTNTPIEYTYPVDVYIDIQDIIDRLDTLINNQNKISFPDFSDLIVDVNGQQAVAVYNVPVDALAIDDYYVTNFGTLVPVFPVFVDYPVNLNKVATISTIGVKDVVPDDILQLFMIGIMGMLFVTLLHRLLE